MLQFFAIRGGKCKVLCSGVTENVGSTSNLLSSWENSLVLHTQRSDFSKQAGCYLFSSIILQHILLFLLLEDLSSG